MQKDGSLAGEHDSDVVFEVAAASFDLFDAYEGALRPLFGMVMRSSTLRWFSVPNAGLDSPVFTAVLERGVRLTNAHVTDIPISEFVLRSVLDHFQHAEALARRPETQGVGSSPVPRGSRNDVAHHRPRRDRSSSRHRGRAFGARVVGCRRTPTGPPEQYGA